MSDKLYELGVYLESRLDKIEEKLNSIFVEIEENYKVSCSNYKTLAQIKEDVEHMKFLAAEPINNEQYKTFIQWLENCDKKSAAEKAAEAEKNIKEGKCSFYSRKDEALSKRENTK